MPNMTTRRRHLRRCHDDGSHDDCADDQKQTKVVVLVLERLRVAQLSRHSPKQNTVQVFVTEFLN